MVRAWAADVTPLYKKECYENYYRTLPDFRKRKADRLHSEEMKAQSVGVWALWTKIRREYGMPEDAPVNFSHSGEYVMCAVVMDNAGDTQRRGSTDGLSQAVGRGAAHSCEKARVGCDLEKIGIFRANVAKRFFCPEEYETLMREKTEEGRTKLFYRYWVLKESFMKATGKGMALPVNAFSIRLGNPPLLIKKPKEFPEAYYYMEYKIEQVPYKMAVCSTDKEIDAKLHMELRL